MKSRKGLPDHLPPRERILQAAHELFYKEGIRATGIDKVIAASKVTKVTFYRCFASKNDLILAFLEYRHQLWMTWFQSALKRYGDDLNALLPTFTEWFRSKDFRGCAFINSTGELGSTLPEVNEISRKHKKDMQSVIARLLTEGYSEQQREEIASAIALAVDGAIVKAQIDQSVDEALYVLDTVLKIISQQNKIVGVK